MTSKNKLQNVLKRIDSLTELALPIGMSKEQFLNIIESGMLENEKIMECNPLSIATTILKASAFGLSVGSAKGEFYLIPRGKQLTGQVGYKGLLTLARRTGEVFEIHAEIIYENDDFDISTGTDRYIKHKPLLSGERGKKICAYATARMKNHNKLVFHYMGIKDIDKRNKNRSQIWRDWNDEMQKKTVINALLKLLPLEDQRIKDAISLNEEQTKQETNEIKIVDAHQSLAPRIEESIEETNQTTECESTIIEVENNEA